MKKRNMRNKIILASLYSFILLDSFFIIRTTYKLAKNNNNCSSRDLSIVSLEDRLLSSTSLTNEERDFLNNSDLFEDILPFINSNQAVREMYETNFKDIQIIPYGKEDVMYNTSNGYFNDKFPNRIFIRDYQGMNAINKDYIAHEFVHLCQQTPGLSLIIEASAEIISNEYFDYAIIPQYSDQVKLLKKLMEIIGAYPVWYYNFTGDFSLIDQSIRPYLTTREYETFLRCLVIDYKDNDVNIENNKKLERFLSILYRCKYNDEIENNPVMSLIDNGSYGLVRNYFNNRKSESYYLDYDHLEVETMDLETAMEKGDIKILCRSKELVMVREGVITCHKLTERYLTADEYKNHRYNNSDTIIIISTGNIDIDSDYTVYKRTPSKVYLKPTFEIEQITRKKADK